MKKQLLFLSFIIGLLTNSIGQNWVQLTSTDLEIPFPETIIKHENDWYLGTAGGIFKTSNSGTSWSLANGNLYNTLYSLRIEGLYSSGPNLIGINRWGGIVYTNDGGVNWMKPTGIPDNAHISQTIALVGSNLVVVVYDYDAQTPAYHLYRSTNNGESWTKGNEVIGAIYDPHIYSNGTTGYIVHTNLSDVDEFIGVTNDGINISSPSFTEAYPGSSIQDATIDQIVFSGTGMIVAGDEAFYRYDLNGVNGWTDISSVWSNGIAFVSIAANESGKLYASVLEGDMSIGFHSSINQGDSWAQHTAPTTIGEPFAIGLYAIGNEFMASFIDDGVHYSSDAGANITKKNSGLLASDFENLYVSGSNMLTSLFISGIYGSTNSGADWEILDSGLPTTDALQRVYGYIHDGTNLYANYSTNPDDDPDPESVYLSSDNGQSWTSITYPAGVDNLKIVGKNNNTLYAMSIINSNALYFTTSDGGNNWNDITSNIPSDFTPTTVSGNGSITFLTGLGIDNKIQVFSSTDNGATAWSNAMTGINVGNLDVMDSDDDILLIATTGTAFLSIRYTGWNNKLLRWNINTWEEASTIGVSNLDLQSIGYHNNTLFISPWGDGVYLSTDNGDNFTKTSNLPNGLAANIFAFNGDIAYISTNRGIWQYTIPTSIDESPYNTSVSLTPNPAYDEVSLNINAEEVKVYSLAGNLIKSISITGNKFSVADLNNGVYVIMITSDKQQFYSKLIKK
jgi:photosystem II stability/assembly factor-like uncharacterized protein